MQGRGSWFGGSLVFGGRWRLGVLPVRIFSAASSTPHRGRAGLPPDSRGLAPLAPPPAGQRVPRCLGLGPPVLGTERHWARRFARDNNNNKHMRRSRNTKLWCRKADCKGGPARFRRVPQRPPSRRRWGDTAHCLRERRMAPYQQCICDVDWYLATVRGNWCAPPIAFPAASL